MPGPWDEEQADLEPIWLHIWNGAGSNPETIICTGTTGNCAGRLRASAGQATRFGHGHLERMRFVIACHKNITKPSYEVRETSSVSAQGRGGGLGRSLRRIS